MAQGVADNVVEIPGVPGDIGIAVSTPALEQGGVADVQPERSQENATGLHGDECAWNPLDFVSPSFLAIFLPMALLLGSWVVTLALARGKDSTLAWVPYASFVAMGTFGLFFGIYWIAFMLTKGEKSYTKVIIGNFWTSALFFAEIALRRQLATFALVASTVPLVVWLRVSSGPRPKFALKFLGILMLFEIPLYGVRRVLPPVLCLTDQISPMITASVYPIMAATYECLYMPFIFFVWGSRDRGDTPELSLHFQLSVVMASSEALFYGGLMQMVSRYPEADLPKCVAMSILGRCFSKIVDRAGFWYWFVSRWWTNQMDPQRDLICRHLSLQYLYGMLFVVMMATSAIGMLAVEDIYERQFDTLYTRPVFWCVVISSASMGALTEISVGFLAYWQRREVSGTFAETFLALHSPGKQPFFTRLREIAGKPAKRDFENIIRAAPTTDMCEPVMNFVTPKDLVIMTAVVVSYAVGPSAQALGFIAEPDSAFCS